MRLPESLQQLLQFLWLAAKSKTVFTNCITQRSGCDGEFLMANALHSRWKKSTICGKLKLLQIYLRASKLAPRF